MKRHLLLLVFLFVTFTQTTLPMAALFNKAATWGPKEWFNNLSSVATKGLFFAHFIEILKRDNDYMNYRCKTWRDMNMQSLISPSAKSYVEYTLLNGGFDPNINVVTGGNEFACFARNKIFDRDTIVIPESFHGAMEYNDFTPQKKKLYDAYFDTFFVSNDFYEAMKFNDRSPEEKKRLTKIHEKFFNDGTVIIPFGRRDIDITMKLKNRTSQERERLIKVHEKFFDELGIKLNDVDTTKNYEAIVDGGTFKTPNEYSWPCTSFFIRHEGVHLRNKDSQTKQFAYLSIPLGVQFVTSVFSKLVNKIIKKPMPVLRGYGKWGALYFKLIATKIDISFFCRYQEDRADEGAIASVLNDQSVESSEKEKILKKTAEFFEAFDEYTLQKLEEGIGPQVRKYPGLSYYNFADPNHPRPLDRANKIRQAIKNL